MTDREQTRRKQADVIRSALASARATAIAGAIADEPPAHTLAAEAAAAKAPFDSALSALDALLTELEQADAKLHAEQRDRNWWAANNSRERQAYEARIAELEAKR